MAGSEHDEDDEVLDISEQLNRPLDVAFHQQRVPAWNPILHPVWVIIALFYFGIIMVPVGYKIKNIQDGVVEEKHTYDSYEPNEGEAMDLSCPIGEEYNAGKLCNVTFIAPRDMTPPILVHYELTNFHQNHRSYYSSFDPYQLQGQVGGDRDSSYETACKPLNRLGDIDIFPCGLIANTYFNDVFNLVGGRDINGDALIMREDGIAWQSDLEYTFAQPDEFRAEVCPDDLITNGTCCEGEEWSCKTPYFDKETGQTFRYFYPFDDTTQYLHETYEGIISPLKGVTDEHFVVWMRVAAQPVFRKLYGWIDQPIAEGEELTFEIQANYVVTRFHGSKSLILGTTSVFGGRNNYFYAFFLVVGYFCLAAGSFFLLKHLIRPRKLADPSYLHFKKE